MAIKKISPTAINALQEALSLIYWYKNPQRTFILHALSNRSEILASVNWQDTKRNIAYFVVESLARNQELYQEDLLKLMYLVAEITDFSHLRNMDDGEKKEKQARNSVNALKNLLNGHIDLSKESELKKIRIEETKRILERNQGLNNKLQDINKRYSELVIAQGPQFRGFELEKILRDLFELFDLDPKASFQTEAEQVDGGFTFEGDDYILEAKWHKKPSEREDLDIFDKKLDRKKENTLGLFVSISGYTDSAIKSHSYKRSPIILFDGFDLMTVLEGRICLKELLLRKRRHASQTGQIFLSIKEVIL